MNRRKLLKRLAGLPLLAVIPPLVGPFGRENEVFDEVTVSAVAGIKAEPHMVVRAPCTWWYSTQTVWAHGAVTEYRIAFDFALTPAEAGALEKRVADAIAAAHRGIYGA